MSKITKPAELKVQQNIKVLAYGQPGLGKTTLGLSAPSPLLLDFDRGVHRVSPAHQTDTVQIEKWEDVQEVLQEDLSGYKTLVIDTAGKMLDFMSNYLIRKDPKLGKQDGSLTLQGYGARKVMFVNFLKQVDQMNKHLVFVAHDKEEKDGEQKIIRPEIGGSSSGDLVKELDLVGYMEAIGKKRTISFDPCEKFYGKNTCQLPSRIELPHLEDGTENKLLTNIFSNYQEHLENRKKIAKGYDSLMTTIKESIDGIADASTANDFVKWVSDPELTHIWDSKLQAGRLFKEKTIALKLVLNPKTKEYEKSKQPVEAAV
ncbi:DNA-binding protein [Pelobium manganitolerans]|uniref:DNA-binding protein n=1 Tax=Pelobium manganitolerans TaxID=1842495 RepID=A0A419S9X5_9SPHI|nr:ATP-binding protein [Pelobium manganitolerans]RKD18985.1 DNA-binding protein [Pelobium manganitolerans]